MPDLTMQCPLPENEAQRLQAIHSYGILDTPPEADFDTLTKAATHAFNTPAAVIGLMDSDRLWFKSQLGLGVQQLDPLGPLLLRLAHRHPDVRVHEVDA